MIPREIAVVPDDAVAIDAGRNRSARGRTGQRIVESGPTGSKHVVQESMVYKARVLIRADNLVAGNAGEIGVGCAGEIKRRPTA